MPPPTLHLLTCDNRVQKSKPQPQPHNHTSPPLLLTLKTFGCLSSACQSCSQTLPPPTARAQGGRCFGGPRRCTLRGSTWRWRPASSRRPSCVPWRPPTRSRKRFTESSATSPEGSSSRSRSVPDILFALERAALVFGLFGCSLGVGASWFLVLGCLVLVAFGCSLLVLASWGLVSLLSASLKARPCPLHGSV